ncbi:fasciclin domain-containing protein [Actinocorallia aurea]
MKRLTALAVASLALALTAGCGADDTGTTMETPGAAGQSTPSAMAGEENFGAGCAAVPAAGAGSFAGMAADPVATAASNNPVLSTLVTAVKKAGLVDTLNSADGITVFAPTNDAFAKIPAKDLKAVLADKDKLTSILTYHVVQGRKTPADLEMGEFTTLQGGTVATQGSGTAYTVGDANVVCGNVQTGNATVYLIDTVLMPAS